MTDSVPAVHRAAHCVPLRRVVLWQSEGDVLMALAAQPSWVWVCSTSIRGWQQGGDCAETPRDRGLWVAAVGPGVQLMCAGSCLTSGLWGIMPRF